MVYRFRRIIKLSHIIMLASRHGDNIHGTFGGRGHFLACTHRLSPQIGVVVSLQSHIEMALIEQATPLFADIGIVAVWREEYAGW